MALLVEILGIVISFTALAMAAARLAILKTDIGTTLLVKWFNLRRPVSRIRGVNKHGSNW